MSVVLHQFQFSHFNDKVRWALDYKGIKHTRETYLPGPHMRYMRQLSGQTSTPVLEWHGEVIANSANIIDRLEREIPAPALYPSDSALLSEALRIQEHFDITVGPATRTVLFAALASEGAYLTSMFGANKSFWKKIAYRAMFPITRGLIKKGNGVTPDMVARRQTITQQALDEVAQQVQGTGYLVGDHFTVADLTAACLFAPLANPSHPDMARPTPIPESVQQILSKYADHPAIVWTNLMYAKHRAGI